MREIDVSSPEDAPAGEIPRHSFCVYGETRSGKTTWAATFPRPLFLSDVTEAGWESIRNIGDDLLFEPGRKPKVFGIEAITDITLAMEKAKPLILSGEVRTLVFDSLTFYCDLYLANMAALQTKPDNRALYGMLGTHLRDLRVKLGSAPVNVVWLCLARPADDTNPVGGPLIPGQQGAKFAAGCNYLLYARRSSTKDASGAQENYFIHSRPYGQYMAGSRLGVNADKLPSPFQGNYAEFMASLGYDVDAIRKAVAGVSDPGAKASVPPAARPAVVPNGAKAPVRPPVRTVAPVVRR